MRIAFVITELDPGGAEKCLVQLATFLKLRKHEVQVFALGPKPRGDRELLTKQLSAAGVPVQFGNANSIWSVLATHRWLRKRLRAFAPDLVQAMLFHANLLTAISADSRQTVCVGGVRVRQPEKWRWRMQRWAAKRMRKLVCVSDDVLRHCARVERIPHSKLVAIPNGIDLAEVDRQLKLAVSLQWAELGVPNNARVLLFVGRLHPQKGIDQLLARNARLLDQLPEHHLVMMGDGPLRPQLEAEARTSLHASRIHLVGWQPNPLQWISRAEQLLLPAEYEGMPNVVLEAMAARRPLVAFDIDGLQQVLGDTANQVVQRQIAPAGDFDAFIDRVQQAASSSSGRLECGAYNRARIEEAFQLSKQMAAYEQLYLSLTKSL